MNIVGIDPSLTCTAVVVNDKKAVFACNKACQTSTGAPKKWFAICDLLVQTFPIDYQTIGGSAYSSTEILKLSAYHEATTRIVRFIKDNVNSSKPTHVFIEGYSYSSSAGPLIDLVTFSTLLRLKLYNWCDSITVIAPQSLKLEAAKLTYPEIRKGRKTEYRNSSGVSGGAFKKHEMYKVLTENSSMNCEWVQFLRGYEVEIMESKSVPKPIEDINDAKLLYEIGLRDKYSKKG